MRQALLLLLIAPLFAGCLAGRAATGVVKATGKAAGTIVETGWDAATTTAEEAEEDRAQEERRARRRAERGGAAPD